MTGRDALPVWGWILWRFAGVIERVEDESVATLFFHFIGPIWPGGSYYVTKQGSFAIPPQRRSIWLGIVRTWSWMIALILGVPAILEPGDWLALLPIALALAGVAAYATWGLGRLDSFERERRALLRRATGLGAPPELLPTEVLERRREDLADAWYDAHLSDWRSAIRSYVADETLVALADYYGERELLVRAHANMFEDLVN